MSTRTEIVTGERDPSSRVRAFATGLLLFMALLFVLAVVEEPAYPWLKWIRAFSEAAMVGALADWYAVTALFRHPMGLRIPHTAIIPANRDRIATRIGSLTQRKLMTPDGIAKLIGSWRIPEELTEALLDPARRRTLSLETARLLVRVLNASEDAVMQRFLRAIAIKVIRGVAVAPLIGQLLSTFLHSKQRDALLHDLLSALMDAVESNRAVLRTLIAEKLPWSRILSLMKLDDTVANKVLDGLVSALRTMRDDPDDAMRAQAIERLGQLAEWLMHDEGALKQEAALKEKLLTYETLLQFVDDLWHGLKQWLLDDVQADRSEILTYLDAVFADAGRMLQTDDDLRAMLHQGVQSLVEDLARRHSDKIGEVVANTIQDWPVVHMVETIEREVGRDLQFIRINGTVVGGLVGLGLHVIARIIER